ncbi:hypothetical protein B0H14DRAFT_2582567 [Mycena olivaceomarginata]|nr:hypothetical protein B0H14DRAFT_2582567 [Mycena olivaceomarginata]
METVCLLVMSECGEGGDCLSLGYNGTDGVRTVWTAIWIWWLLSGPVFYRAKLAKMVVLIEEAWGREKGAQDEVQVWGKAGILIAVFNLCHPVKLKDCSSSFFLFNVRGGMTKIAIKLTKKNAITDYEFEYVPLVWCFQGVGDIMRCFGVLKRQSSRRSHEARRPQDTFGASGTARWSCLKALKW